jgi:hypothetical protein
LKNVTYYKPKFDLQTLPNPKNIQNIKPKRPRHPVLFKLTSFKVCWIIFFSGAAVYCLFSGVAAFFTKRKLFWIVSAKVWACVLLILSACSLTLLALSAIFLAILIRATQYTYMANNSELTFWRNASGLEHGDLAVRGRMSVDEVSSINENLSKFLVEIE